MSSERLATQLVDASREGSASQPRSRRRLIMLILFLLSFVFSALAFIAFDYFYSAAIFRTSVPVKPNPCRVRDPVRHHAVKPNCAFVEPWGRDTLEFFTNSLGLRDEKVREVPLAEARPRILMLGNSFTEGLIAWRDSYVGRIAAHFPQYDFLNGGMNAYSASNHLNTARMVLSAGVELDEVIVFLDASDLDNEAAFHHDVDTSGA